MDYDENSNWRKIYNATADQLQWKKNFTVVSTRLKNHDSQTFVKMMEWCEENVKGSWGPGKLRDYGGFITFRFWRDDEAEEFIEEFKRFTTGKEFLSY